jgi:hypothetical protein
MKAENLYHTGVVVDDLDATLDWLTKVGGYRRDGLLGQHAEIGDPEFSPPRGLRRTLGRRSVLCAMSYEIAAVAVDAVGRLATDLW